MGIVVAGTYEPRRFRSTVPFYAAYRVPYPDALIAFVAGRCGLAPGSPVLDLGCGPGPLAVAFARLGCTVTAMDPEPDMLAATAAHAAASGVTVDLVRGSSFDLGARDGPFQLIAMGRSFHWMDRQATLQALDGIVDPSGAVVLFGDRRVATPGADWAALLHDLSMEMVPERMAQRRQSEPAWEPHEAVLLRSPFRHLTLHGMTVARRYPRTTSLAWRSRSLSPRRRRSARSARRSSTACATGSTGWHQMANSTRSSRSAPSLRGEARAGERPLAAPQVAQPKRTILEFRRCPLHKSGALRSRRFDCACVGSGSMHCEGRKRE